MKIVLKMPIPFFILDIEFGDYITIFLDRDFLISVCLFVLTFHRIKRDEEGPSSDLT